MSALFKHGAVIPDARSVRTVLTTLALAVGGGIVSLVSASVYRLAGDAVGIVDTDAFAVADIGVQLGFGLILVIYLLAADDWSQYVKLRWPTLEDIAWIIVLPGISAGLGIVLGSILPVLGITVPAHSDSGAGTAELLLQEPILWAIAIPTLYLFAAPAEELLYRGVVQERLRPYFGTAGIVLVSGLAFGLMHAVAFAFVSGPLAYSVISIGAFGVVWALVYERTENLVVTAVSHAMFWTVSLQTVLPI